MEFLTFKIKSISFIIVLIIYFLPSIIACWKKKKNTGAIILTNFIPICMGNFIYYGNDMPLSALSKAMEGDFQFTVIGLVVWIIALIWATTNDSQEKKQ
jgi:hypothetical protein